MFAADGVHWLEGGSVRCHCELADGPAVAVGAVAGVAGVAGVAAAAQAAVPRSKSVAARTHALVRATCCGSERPRVRSGPFVVAAAAARAAAGTVCIALGYGTGGTELARSLRPAPPAARGKASPEKSEGGSPSSAAAAAARGAGTHDLEAGWGCVYQNWTRRWSWGKTEGISEAGECH